MGHARCYLGLMFLLFAAPSHAAVQGLPVYVATGVPVGSCIGNRVWLTDTNPSITYCCLNSTWVSCTASVGPKGDTGATGPTGARGPAGVTGPKGDTGATGARGLTGAAGTPGATGATGPQGAPGTNGLDGLDGANGSKGDQGETGPTGATGVAGSNGQSVTAAAAGGHCTYGGVAYTSITGVDYVCNGAPGSTGATGATGAQGPAGPTKTCTTGYAVQDASTCTNMIDNAGFASSADEATVATNLQCAGACVADSEIDSVSVSKLGHGCLDAEYIGPVAGTMGCKSLPIGTVTTGKWCYGNYGNVICTMDEPNALARATLTCPTGGAPIWNGTTWGCGWMPGMTGSCTGGQVAGWNGSAWVCVTVASTVTKLTTDRTSTSTHYADVTGLAWAVAASTTYSIDCYLTYESEATTTGLGVAINGPTEATMSYSVHIWEGSAFGQVSHHASPDDTTATVSVDAANTAYFAYLKGWLRTPASTGTLAVRFASEMGGSTVTIKAGSWCRVE